MQNETVQNLSHDYFQQAYDSEKNHHLQSSFSGKKLRENFLSQEIIHNN
jgi:hypothetical protein